MEITEIFPNPSGNDSGKEWIEVLNSGNKDLNLSGWYFMLGEKKFSIGKKIVQKGEFPVIDIPAKGFSLLNKDGAVSLFSPRGDEISKISFMGASPEDLSFQKEGDIFFFGNPSPGTKNLVREIPKDHYQNNILEASFKDILFWGMFLSFILAVAVVWLVILGDDKEKSLAERNREFRGRISPEDT